MNVSDHINLVNLQLAAHHSKRLYWGLFLASLILIGCSASSKQPIASPNANSASNIATTSHQPGTSDVSTMVPGQPFDATPNFFYFQACERPCWLPVYPSPELVKGNSVTQGYPCEYRLPATETQACQGTPLTGDRVRVICQTTGNSLLGSGTLQNENGQRSNLWDKIELPPSKTVNFPPGLEAPYAYGWDGWLGNTGDHHLPCKNNNPSIRQTGPN